MDTQNIDTEGHLMTVNEIAAFLKVPRSWVYSRTRMAPENGFPVFKLGRYCRFSKDKVTRWLNEKAATVKGLGFRKARSHSPHRKTPLSA